MNLKKYIPIVSNYNFIVEPSNGWFAWNELGPLSITPAISESSSGVCIFSESF